MLLELITQVLDSEQKAKLAIQLASDLENSNLLNTLCELLPYLDEACKNTVYQNVLTYWSRSVENPEIGYAKLDALIAGFDNLKDDLLSLINGKLDQYLSQISLAAIVPEILQLSKSESVHKKESSNELVETNIVPILKFLDFTFLNNILGSQRSAIDEKLVILLGSNDETISSLVSALYRWRIGAIEDPWPVIYALEEQKSLVHKSHAFVLWIRYLNHQNEEAAKSNLAFQDHLSSENYWIPIQNGLKSKIAEHRKFCLSILQHSVKLISSSFENSSMKWDATKLKLYLEEWARFVTLFEIIAIDTSAHQAEAGSKDIIGFIAPESLIHPSWGFCLLQSGFTASMDSVRKFTLSLFFSLPDKSLPMIKYALDGFENIFLPYSMLAQHFHVRKLDHATNERGCVYGDQLTSFVSRIIKEDVNQIAPLATAILGAVANCDTFSPAKIYVTLGLLEGLANLKCLEIGSTAEHILIELMELKPEGDVFTRTFQTIILLLTTHFKVTLNEDLKQFIALLEKFGKFNGYTLIKEHLNQFKNFLSEFSVNSFKEIYDSVSAKALTFGLCKSLYGVEIPLHDDSLRIEVVSQNLVDVDFSKLPEFSTKEHELFFFENAIGITNFSIDLSEEFFATLEKEVQADDSFTLQLASKKLVFLSEINQRFDFINVNRLINFYGILFKNSKPVAKADNQFFKVRNQAFSLYYKVLQNYISPTSVTIEIASKILSVIDSSESNGGVALEIVKIIDILIQSATIIEASSVYIEFIQALYDIWSSISSERLFLNQKELHILLIKSLLNPHAIFKSLEDETVSENLLNFSVQIIDLSEGRRSFLPTLSKCISDFQLKYPEQFPLCQWIPEVLVRCFVVLQLQANVFKIENVIGKLYDSKLSPEPLTSDIYTQVYGLPEIAARINVVTIVASTKSEAFSKNLWDWVISNEEEFLLFDVIKKTDGFEEWRRIQIFSLLLISIKSFDKKYVADNYLSIFTKIIETEPSPLVRVYIEWIISFCLVEDEKTKDEFINKFINSTDSPTLLVSYERMLFLMIQQLPKAKEEQVMEEYLEVLLPAATSNKAITRHFSLSLICAVHTEIEKKNLDIKPELKIVVQNIYDSALTSEAYGSYRSGDATLWDISQDFDLVSITGVVLLRASERELDFISRESYLECLSRDQQEALNIPIGDNNEHLWVDRRKQSTKKKSINIRDIAGTSSTPLQTKSGALNAVIDVDEDTRVVHRSDLIVVASLVDKPPNLGGICRLSDVLGAGTLTLHDLKVKDHSQFKTVAVTADRWMPMVEVKPEDIISYFHAKKKEGYTLIGLEQTDKSVQLDSNLKFPKKSLILLGREKEGIPGDLLAELDFCVEIKQVGVIRSMNIQTATAVIVHAYSMQHC